MRIGGLYILHKTDPTGLSGGRLNPPNYSKRSDPLLTVHVVVQSKIKVLGVTVEVFFYFLLGSGITIAHIVGKLTSIVLIYFMPMNQPSVLINSPGK